MMLLGSPLQPKGAKRRKIIVETADIKDGLIRTVKLLKEELLVSAKSLPRFPKDPIVRLVKNKEHSFRKRYWTVLVYVREIIINCFGHGR